MTNQEATKAELLAQLTTETLIQQRIILEAKTETTDDETQLSIWFANEVEDRHPEILDTLDAILNEDLEIAYGEALMKAWRMVAA
jgi:hypothetical protein